MPRLRLRVAGSAAATVAAPPPADARRGADACRGAAGSAVRHEVRLRRTRHPPWGAWPPYGFDVIDVIESRRHDIPARCTGCNEAWLTGPEALAAGKCWRCRTNGGVA